MQIALDLDGVLADLQHTMCEQTIYDEQDFEQWSKPKYNHFVQEASRVWREHWDDIPPVESGLDELTKRLSTTHNVDIVTNTAGPNEYIEQWVDKHGIQHDSIRRPYSEGKDKHELIDYDCYIDDKPGMAGQVDVLYLRDRAWNQTVRGNGEYLYHSYEECYVDSEGVLKSDPFVSSSPWVIRVTGIADVLRDLKLQVDPNEL
jgi:hypothetical protein